MQLIDFSEIFRTEQLCRIRFKELRDKEGVM